MRRRLAILLCLATAAAPALADDWRPYANARFGYVVDLPPGFAISNEADNGDGMTLTSADKQAELRVFGANRMEQDFETEMKIRVGMDEKEGWKISYSKPAKSWASYSGSRKDRILYVRAIALCHDAVGYATIEYPKTALKQYDPIIQHLVKSLSAPPRCS